GLQDGSGGSRARRLVANALPRRLDRRCFLTPGPDGRRRRRAFAYGDRVSALRPVVLRNGVDVDDPLRVALDFVEAYGRLEGGAPSRPSSFGEPDLRLANRGGARISAAEIAAILERRRAIERSLRAIAPQASLAGEADDVPWTPLGQLFDAFGGIR